MKTFADISLRTRNALETKGITTFERLSEMSDSELERINGVGRKGIREIRRIMIEAEIPIPEAYL